MTRDNIMEFLQKVIRNKYTTSTHEKTLNKVGTGT